MGGRISWNFSSVLKNIVSIFFGPISFMDKTLSDLVVM